MTHRILKAALGKFSRVLIILDLAGMSFSHIRNIGIVKAVGKMGMTNFPESSFKVIACNTPM